MNRARALVLAPAGGVADVRVRNAAMVLRALGADVTVALPDDGATRTFTEVADVRLEWFPAPEALVRRTVATSPARERTLRADRALVAAEERLRDWDRQVAEARGRLGGERPGSGSGHPLKRLGARLAGRHDGLVHPGEEAERSLADRAATSLRRRLATARAKAPLAGGLGRRRRERVARWEVELAMLDLLGGRELDLVYVLAAHALPGVMAALAHGAGRAPAVVCDWPDLPADAAVRRAAARTVAASASSRWLAGALRERLGGAPEAVPVLGTALDIPLETLPESRPITKAARSVDDPLVVVPWSDALAPVADALERLVDGTPFRLALLATTADMPAARRTIDPYTRGLKAPRIRPVLGPDPDRLPSVVRGAAAWVEPSALTGEDDGTLPSGLLAAVAAGVPVVVSAGAPAQAELCRELGCGGVVDAPGADAVLAAVVRARGHERPRAAVDERPTAAAQRAALRGLLAPLVTGAAPRDRAERRIAMGPRNINNNLRGWSAAVRRTAPGLETEIYEVDFKGSETMRLAGEHPLIPFSSWEDPAWSAWWTRHLVSSFSHVLVEQGLTACGWLHGKSWQYDVPTLRRHGITVGLIFNGSDVRDPRAHAEREPFSPFTDPDHPRTQRLQKRADRLGPLLRRFEGPKFVTTPDLLDDVPGAMWLPQVVDLERWSAGPPALEREVPVVLHAPSNEALKGTAAVDAACRALADAGVIEFRRLAKVPPSEMPDAIRGADVVVDQLALGSYGVLAQQAMATGRVVVGHVADRVRARVPGGVPIVQADPDTLAEVLTELAADPARFHAQRERGPAYVRRFHDGTVSGARLAAFAGVELAAELRARLDEVDAAARDASHAAAS